MALMRTLAIALAGGWATLSPPGAGAADSAPPSGEVAFNNHCRTCHSIKPGDNRQGPSLYGVVGRKAGTAPGYTTYSQSLIGSGIVWDAEALDRFIANPEQTVPGNKMKPFTGIADPGVRERIIRFLASNGG